MSILHKVVSHGRVHQLRLLLKMGRQIKVNPRDDTEKTPLILCALIDDEQLGMKMFNLLMEDPRTDHDATDIYNRNIFTYAIMKGRTALLHVLLENKATITMNNTDANGLSNLHHAVIYGDASILTLIIKLFRELGLGVDPRSSDGVTPLILAIKMEHFECANLLLIEGNANYLLKESVNYRSSRDWANLKLKKIEAQRANKMTRLGLLSRAKTEQRMTLRRRGERSPPRSALTAPTAGLPFLTTRASKKRSIDSDAFNYNELKKLHMILHSKFTGEQPKFANKRETRVRFNTEPLPSTMSSTESLPPIYRLLQEQIWATEFAREPLLPVNCSLPYTRFNSAKTSSSLLSHK